MLNLPGDRTRSGSPHALTHRLKGFYEELKSLEKEVNGVIEVGLPVSEQYISILKTLTRSGEMKARRFFADR